MSALSFRAAALRLLTPTSLGLLFQFSLACPLGAADAPQRPNVVLILIDDLNASLGCFGAPVKTPHIDRLASRGVQFDRAYCQTPLCNPSRTSLLSGRRPSSTGVWDNTTAPRASLGGVEFLPEFFRRHGYWTARVGKIAHSPYERLLRWDFAECQRMLSPEAIAAFDRRWQAGERERALSDPVFNELFASYEPKMAPLIHLSQKLQPGLLPNWNTRQIGWRLGAVNILATNGTEEEEADGRTARRVADLLGRASKSPGKPFLIAAGFARPHLPWVAPKKYFDLYANEDLASSNDAEGESWPTIATSPMSKLASNSRGVAARREAVAAYYACVSFVDAQVGVVLDTLDRLKLKENTLVVLASDHGYHLGDHAGMWHKDTLFEASARVPLIVAGPGVTQGAVARGLVELVDLFPTLADFAGLTPPQGLEGTSFAPLLAEPRQPWKRAAFTEVMRKSDGKLVIGRSIRTEKGRYTEWGSPLVAEFYDHDRDPGERVNLARTPANAASSRARTPANAASSRARTPANAASSRARTPANAASLGEHRRLLDAGWRVAGPASPEVVAQTSPSPSSN